jgi:hypothetical protein
VKSEGPKNENSRWQARGDKTKIKTGMAADQEGLLVTWSLILGFARHLSLVTPLWSLVTVCEEQE